MSWCNFVFIVLLYGGAALAGDPDAPGFTHTGSVHDRDLQEISGIAASHAHPGVFWVHNDSGNAAALYAINERGEILARVRLIGVENVDWEDIALYEENGFSYIALGDIGDNFAWRSQVGIVLLPEPALDATEAAPLREYRFTYDGGPRDAESLAVDLHHHRFLILDKGRWPVGLYALSMTEPQAIARRIADLSTTWPEKVAPVQPIESRWRGSPTAMDLSADGLRMLVLTYRHALLYERAPDEDWTAAFARRPRVSRLPAVRGFEAACFSADGSGAYVTGEGERARLYRWTPPRP